MYAPTDDTNEDAFHRTLYLFISPEGDKLAQPGTVRALRCQLPRSNDFYSYDPPKQEQDAPPKLTVSRCAFRFLFAGRWRFIREHAARCRAMRLQFNNAAAKHHHSLNYSYVVLMNHVCL